MSDARSTIELSILDGLTRNPNVSRAIRPEGIAEQAIKDIIEAMFALPVRWAVVEYLAEIKQQDD